MDNEELEKIMKESTEFVDRLKDKVHEQEFEIERLKLIINAINKYCEEHEDYEYGTLIEQLHEADIEWLRNVVRR